MPDAMVGGSRVRYNNSFVIVGGQVYECDDECEEGGYVFDKESNALYQYLPDNGTFLELPGKMKYRGCPKGDPLCGNLAMIVERSIFPACPSTTTTTTTPATDNGASSMSSLLAAQTLLLATIFCLVH